MPEPTDEFLARDARAGSRADFEQLVRRYQVGLVRFLERGPAPAHAEDDVQETFLRVYRSLEKYNPDRPFRPWLFSVAYRIALDRRRSIRKTKTVDENLAGDRSRDPAVVAGRFDDRGHLWSTARRALKPDPFSCLWLHYTEAMPVAEVAAALGRSRVWVKTSLVRSRRKLKSLLEAEHGETNRDRRTSGGGPSGPNRKTTLPAGVT